MNTLDSRLIRLGNCFAHRFSAPGTFVYALSPIASSIAAHHDEPPARAVVVTAEAGADQRQHYIKVSMVGRELTAKPAELRVTAGDLVVWSADRSVTFGFRVRGMIEDELIDSASLHTESIFTHVFGLPGRYEWADANGSGLRGHVRVAKPDTAAGHEEWLGRLQQGTLVQVQGERVEPETVDIVVGQTVVWAVKDAPGVTITDTSLIAAVPATEQTG